MLHKLENANAQPDEEVIAALEAALGYARSGRLRSVMIAGSMTGNNTLTSYSTRDLLELAGLLSFALHTINTKHYNVPEHK